MLVNVRKYEGGITLCNGYLVRGESGYVAVDAPLGFADWVMARLPEGEQLTELILTHQHFDHVEDAARLQKLTSCRICAHSPYSRELTLEKQAAAYWGAEPPPPYVVDEVLGSERTVAHWGGLEWQLYAIPGHSPDGMAYGIASRKHLFSGDILFAESIGNTEFPGGNLASLLAGIREKLLVLEPETEVFCGHGRRTSIQEEMLNNPYLT